MKQCGIGDIVYIYCGKPYQKIAFKCIVTEITKIEDPNLDKEFYKKNISFGAFKEHIKLKLIKKINEEKLSLENLKKHGLKSALQGPLNLDNNLNLKIYIKDVLKIEIKKENVG